MYFHELSSSAERHRAYVYIYIYIYKTYALRLIGDGSHHSLKIVHYEHLVDDRLDTGELNAEHKWTQLGGRFNQHILTFIYGGWRQNMGYESQMMVLLIDTFNFYETVLVKGAPAYRNAQITRDFVNASLGQLTWDLDHVYGKVSIDPYFTITNHYYTK